MLTLSPVKTTTRPDGFAVLGARAVLAVPMEQGRRGLGLEVKLYPRQRGGPPMTREEKLQYNCEYRSANREEIQASWKAYHEKHRDALLESARRYAREHKQELANKRREKYHADPKAARARAKKWEEANPDKLRAMRKRSREKNRNKIRARYEDWKRRNPTYFQEYGRKNYRGNENFLKRVRERNRSLRLELIAAYGGKCECCGESLPECLALDHRHGDGGKRRKLGEPIGPNLYMRLKKAGWPKEDFRLLCHNCNLAFNVTCSCPHRRDFEEERRPPKMTYQAKRDRALKLEMIEAYGGKCACCGETEPLFMSIDHVNGGGRREVLRLGRCGASMYYHAKCLGWPKKYRALCMSCNHALGVSGRCRHTEER